MWHARLNLLDHGAGHVAPSSGHICTPPTNLPCGNPTLDVLSSDRIALYPPSLRQPPKLSFMEATPLLYLGFVAAPPLARARRLWLMMTPHLRFSRSHLMRWQALLITPPRHLLPCSLPRTERWYPSSSPLLSPLASRLPTPPLCLWALWPNYPSLAP
ncbi:hypothetical protein AMTR_s00018p00219200 [Amborella trichopoda]|uniref:Uncharacterized protein n=1 Tax=Amborella trichopoda TaxID=13333 RepID=W1PKI5_AMBTC|nr:hypothetical protein AMTR_s00018p00219200 [Amborella trichopoda]